MAVTRLAVITALIVPALSLSFYVCPLLSFPLVSSLIPFHCCILVRADDLLCRIFFLKPLPSVDLDTSSAAWLCCRGHLKLKWCPNCLLIVLHCLNNDRTKCIDIEMMHNQNQNLETHHLYFLPLLVRVGNEGISKTSSSLRLLSTFCSSSWRMHTCLQDRLCIYSLSSCLVLAHSQTWGATPTNNLIRFPNRLNWHFQLQRESGSAQGFF